MYVVIAYQGHQFIVKQWDEITVDRVEASEGDSITIDTVIARFVEDGSDVSVGTPYLKQSVVAKVLSHGRADKIRVIKFQSKKRYMRTIWHRQDQSVLSIESIG